MLNLVMPTTIPSQLPLDNPSRFEPEIEPDICFYCDGVGTTGGYYEIAGETVDDITECIVCAGTGYDDSNPPEVECPPENVIFVDFELARLLNDQSEDELYEAYRSVGGYRL